MKMFKIKRVGDDYFVFSRTWLLFWHKENIRYHESYCGMHSWNVHTPFTSYAKALTFVTGIRKKIYPTKTYYV